MNCFLGLGATHLIFPLCALHTDGLMSPVVETGTSSIAAAGTTIVCSHGLTKQVSLLTWIYSEQQVCGRMELEDGSENESLCMSLSYLEGNLIPPTCEVGEE